MEKKYNIIVLVVAVLVGIVIALVASSLQKLTTEEAALQYDVHQRVLKPMVYRAGLHLGPPGFRFIIFPNNYKTVYFKEIKCLNKDGLVVELNVHYQYLVNTANDNLMTLVLKYGDHKRYLVVVHDVSEEVIHEQCSTFNVTQFQTSRNQFQLNLFNALRIRLGGDLLTHVRDVQISNIRRPEQYEQVVIGKESARQNIDVAMEERPRILTAANTKKIEAETQANITLNRARTDGRITITRATSEAKAILNAYTTEAETYKTIMDNQNLTITGFLSYLTTRAIQSVKEPVYVNLDAPAKTTFP